MRDKEGGGGLKFLMQNSILHVFRCFSNLTSQERGVRIFCPFVTTGRRGSKMPIFVWRPLLMTPNVEVILWEFPNFPQNFNRCQFPSSLFSLIFFSSFTEKRVLIMIAKLPSFNKIHLNFLSEILESHLEALHQAKLLFHRNLKVFSLLHSCWRIFTEKASLAPKISF